MTDMSVLAVGPPGAFWLVDALGHVAGGVVSAAGNALGGGMSRAVGQLLAVLGTLWIRLDVPNIWTGGTASGTVRYLNSQVAYVAAALAVLGIIVGGARIAITQRAGALRELGEGVFLWTIVTAAGVPVIGLLTGFADEWSQAIITNALHGGDFGRNVGEMLKLTGPLEPVLAFVFACIAAFGSLLMICELAFRSGTLVVAAGLLPVVASMAVFPGGKHHVNRYGTWVLAVIMWKPVAAFIYATAFRLIGAHELDSSGVGSALIGLTLMFAAILALPALVSFLAPAVGAVHSRSPSPVPSSPVAVVTKAGATGAKAVSYTQPAGRGAAMAAQTQQGPSGTRNGAHPHRPHWQFEEHPSVKSPPQPAPRPPRTPPADNGRRDA